MAEVVTSSNRGRAMGDFAQEPAYLRVRRVVMERIERGEYAAGAPIPSENELAAEFDATRVVVRTAIDALVEQGLVRRIQGKGAFISHGWFDGTVDLGGFREVARSQNARAEVRILSKSRRLAGPLFSHLFGIEPSAVLYSIRRLNSVDGEPLTLENTLIPLEFFEGIEQVDISVFSLYETYEMLGHKVAIAQEKLGIEALNARDARLLQAKPGSAVLVLECLSFDDRGHAIEYARSLTRGDRGGYSNAY